MQLVIGLAVGNLSERQGDNVTNLIAGFYRDSAVQEIYLHPTVRLNSTSSVEPSQISLKIISETWHVLQHLGHRKHSQQ